MPTLEDYEKHYDDMIGYTPERVRERIKVGLELDPELLHQIETLRLNALTPDCLDPKTVQLIAFAILLTQRAPAAVNHGRAAVKVGATKEQLHAAVALAFLFGGIGPLNLGGEAIRDIFDGGKV
ncbi:MAG: carboxymuconolactone decarboxylase family protein [Alphaproteobacteria bacterium]